MPFALAVATPLLAFFGALVGQVLSLKSAHQLEARSRREETLRNLRWAAELAVDRDEDRAKLGLAELEALSRSDLLDASELVFVDAAFDAALSRAEDAAQRGDSRAVGLVPLSEIGDQQE